MTIQLLGLNLTTDLPANTARYSDSAGLGQQLSRARTRVLIVHRERKTTLGHSFKPMVDQGEC